MPRLIKNRQIVEDHWLLLKEADGDKLRELAVSDLIIPLQSWLDWQQEREEAPANRSGRMRRCAGRK